MITTLPPELERALYQRRSREAILVFLTLEHERLDGPLRFVNNARGANIKRGVDEFMAYPFGCRMPKDSDSVPTAELAIANLDRRIMEAIQNINTAVRVTFDLAPASMPQTIVRHFPHMLLLDIEATETEVSGQLKMLSIENEPWPNIQVNPYRFPGLY